MPPPSPAAHSCLSGCECPPTRFNGHAEEKKSLLVLHRMYATQHPECMLGIEVLKDTDRWVVACDCVCILSMQAAAASTRSVCWGLKCSKTLTGADS